MSEETQRSTWRSGPRNRLGALALGVVIVAALPTAAALGEAGDGGDPGFVNLRTAFPPGLHLGPRLGGRVRAFSEAAGPRRTPFTGTARLGLSGPGPSLRLAKAIVTVPLHGTAGTEKPLRISLSARQRQELHAAAGRAGRRSIVLNLRLSGTPRGQPRPSRTNVSYRVVIRAQMLADGTPPAYVDAFFRFFSAGETDGTTLSDTVERVTGQTPRSFRAWAKATPPRSAERPRGGPGRSARMALVVRIGARP